MSRIGAKASRARKEGKIREVVRLAISEGLIAPPVKRLHDMSGNGRHADAPKSLDPFDPPIGETGLEARLYLGFLTTTIALGIACAFYSFLNP
jgi:hypothetical protein